MPAETPPPENLTDQISHYVKITTNLPDEQIAQLVDIARRNLAEILANAEKTLQEEDYTALGNYAHKLKGILLQCGLSVLAEKAQEVHTHTKAPENCPFAANLEEIKTGVSGLLKGL